MIGVTEDERLLFDAEMAVERLLTLIQNEKGLTQDDRAEVVKDCKTVLGRLHRRLFT